MDKLIVVGLLAILLAGCVFQGQDGENLKLGIDNQGFYLQQNFQGAGETTYFLKALVKGSIYETGETVSVFGTCLDADDYPAENVTAVFSSWYPNGTALQINVTMTEIQPGYFLYTGPMDAVQGTYLTEMTCIQNFTGLIAKAYGEWQNPYWVARIGTTEDLLQNLTNLTQNISINLGNLTFMVNNSFEIVYDKFESINQTIIIEHNTTNNLIREGFNNTYSNQTLIIKLLQNITGIVTPPVSGTPVSHQEYPNPVRYFSNWNIFVDTYSTANITRVHPPEVQCLINTTITPGYQLMTPVYDEDECDNDADQCHDFKFTQFITIRGDYNWNINCTYI